MFLLIMLYCIFFFRRKIFYTCTLDESLISLIIWNGLYCFIYVQFRESYEMDKQVLQNLSREYLFKVGYSRPKKMILELMFVYRCCALSAQISRQILVIFGRIYVHIFCHKAERFIFYITLNLEVTAIRQQHKITFSSILATTILLKCSS